MSLCDPRRKWPRNSELLKFECSSQNSAEKMTVCGLPQSLEKCLGSLLQDNTLSSWRIFSADGGGHSVTIRFSPHETTQHGEQHSSQAGGWYRKGNAKVKRDRERWVKYQDRLKCDSSSHQSESTECKDTLTYNTTSKDDNEGCVTKCKQKQHTPSSSPHTLPDPSRTTRQRDDNTRRNPPLPSVPDARDSRTGRSRGDEMEIASGDSRTEAEYSSEEGSDTDSEWDDRPTPREIIVRTVKKAKCSTLTRDLIKQKGRNKVFRKVVIDRRGRGVPSLVCFSNDVILTFNTGTGVKDFHIIERRSAGTCHGDDLYKYCMEWPDIDRGGIYKDTIEELNNDLLWAMIITRNLLFGEWSIWFDLNLIWIRNDNGHAFTEIRLSHTTCCIATVYWFALIMCFLISCFLQICSIQCTLQCIEIRKASRHVPRPVYPANGRLL